MAPCCFLLSAQADPGPHPLRVNSHGKAHEPLHCLSRQKRDREKRPSRSRLPPRPVFACADTPVWGILPERARHIGNAAGGRVVSVRARSGKRPTLKPFTGFLRSGDQSRRGQSVPRLPGRPGGQKLTVVSSARSPQRRPGTLPALLAPFLPTACRRPA